MYRSLSASSTIASVNGSVYSATKAAVDAVTKSLAKELGPRNIRVNAINPGLVETEAGLADRIPCQTPGIVGCVI